MAAIYSGAFLTISGTGCIDGNEGLFRDSPISAGTEMITGTSPWQVYVGPPVHHPSHDDVFDFRYSAFMNLESSQYPLASRGWTFQERALSKRVIHFTQQEVLWECMENSQCECGYYTKSKANYEFLDLPWRRIIEVYSQMDLTRPTDRLPAVAGLAKAYAKRYSLTYWAGLWKETIRRDLLWEYSKPYQLPRPKLEPRFRPLTAPTWSWASVKPLYDFKNVILVNEWVYVEVMGYEFTGDEGGDEYCQPIKACLYVKGPVLFGTIADDWPPNERELTMKFGDKTALFRPDYDISAAGEDHVEFSTDLPFLLVLNSAGGVYGIVLKCKDKDRNEYERIGLLCYGEQLLLKKIGEELREVERERVDCSWVLERAETMELVLI